ncbi:dihydropteroate synthase [Thermogymnomonas acidicola]|uniref:dihydropteroate synthase n=1 Tax=Thermogymnomonas acidicola TaxID=399579 RepID=UPI000ACF03B1|nr:dihydropteroate synthase [Thermogymnomonas acidicola]
MVMGGIINATPDSFYEGSRVGSEPVKKIEEMLDQKPDIIDVGGESTRPGSDPVPPKEEIKRLRPVVEYLTEVSDIPVSIDTRNPETLEDMLRYDIDYVNDITGFTNEAMLSLTTSADLKCIVMHMRGDPKTMQSMTDYRDVVYEVASFLQAQARKIIEVGAEPESIVVDPGLASPRTLCRTWY